jgi:hypothetical protein
MSFPLRIGLLLTLLVAEAALVVSLRTVGWNSTGRAIRWTSCLLAAFLPLALVAIAICGQRFRFSLRMLLIAMGLVAVFLWATVLPLRNAVDARRASQSLLAAGATLRTASSFDEVYAHLKYDPRPSRPAPAIDRPLAVWLRPLAGDILKVPTADAIKEIWLESDAQIAALRQDSSSFSNLERLGVSTAVTPAGMSALRSALPAGAHMTDILLNVDVPQGWLSSLNGVRTLSLWAEGPRAGLPLSREQFQAIAALPELRVLWIFGYAVTDADIQILSGCKTLKHVVFRKTAVTAAGEEQLSRALPDCVVHLD